MPKSFAKLEMKNHSPAAHLFYKAVKVRTEKNIKFEVSEPKTKNSFSMAHAENFCRIPDKNRNRKNKKRTKCSVGGLNRAVLHPKIKNKINTNKKFVELTEVLTID